MIGETRYHVRTDIFEGPLELLLELIERRTLAINEVSLAKVADDFINYVNTHANFPIAETAHFVLIAATLLLIKSKSLLPTMELTEEERASVEDLERRLVLYRKFREIADRLQQGATCASLYARERAVERPIVFAPHSKMTLPNIHASIVSLISSLRANEHSIPKTVVKKVISLEEMIEQLAKRIQSSLKVSFREFSKKDRAERMEVIVGFLAMLELVKQGMIAVVQEDRFSDIIMSNDRIDTPRYV